jgi:hypothetical protein
MFSKLIFLTTLMVGTFKVSSLVRRQIEVLPDTDTLTAIYIEDHESNSYMELTTSMSALPPSPRWTSSSPAVPTCLLPDQARPPAVGQDLCVDLLSLPVPGPPHHPLRNKTRTFIFSMDFGKLIFL